MLVCDEEAETVLDLNHTDELSLEIIVFDTTFGEDGMRVVWSEVVNSRCVDMVASNDVKNNGSVLRDVETGSCFLGVVLLCSGSV